MEFGSLGLGTQSQPASNQTGVVSLAQTSTLATNPENAVTPVDDGSAAQNDRRQDSLGQDDASRGNSDSQQASAPEDLQLTSRRTTLNFDSEQNRIFLEVVDSTTEEVIEQIPSEKFVEFVANALESEEDSSAQESDERSQEDQTTV